MDSYLSWPLLDQNAQAVLAFYAPLPQVDAPSVESFDKEIEGMDLTDPFCYTLPSFRDSTSILPSLTELGSNFATSEYSSRDLRHVGSPVNFGPIDYDLASLSTIKPARSVRFFGTVPVQNGVSDATKSMVTNRLPQLPSAPSTSSTQSAAAPTSTPPPIQKFADFELFQDPAPPFEAASRYSSLLSQAPGFTDYLQTFPPESHVFDSDQLIFGPLDIDDSRRHDSTLPFPWDATGTLPTSPGPARSATASTASSASLLDFTNSLPSSDLSITPGSFNTVLIGGTLCTIGSDFSTTEDVPASLVRLAAPIFCSFTQGLATEWGNNSQQASQG
jgi:hypothetical protein